MTTHAASSLDRKQDPRASVRGRRNAAARLADVDAQAPLEVRLAAAVHQLRHNRDALLAFLEEEVAPRDRVAARVVLARELGLALGRELGGRAFGPTALPFAALHGPVGATAVAAPSLDLARARSLAELLLSPSLRGALAGDLLSLMEPHVAAAARALARRRPHAPAEPDGDGDAAATGALREVVERRAERLYRAANSDGSEGDPEDPAVAEARRRRGAGVPVPEPLRRELERQLGGSFAGVRLHVDATAAAAARALGARAFTLGEDLFFADGAFAPDEEAGRALLVHELTHVLQGHEGRAAAPTRPVVSEPHEPLEREADAAAERTRLSADRQDPVATPTKADTKY